MNTINPALSSSSATAQTPSGSIAQEEARRLTTQTNGSTSNSGNTTVTLSDQAQKLSQADLNLQASQTVQGNESVDNRTVEPEQTNSDLTYTTNLQGQNQYSQSANQMIEPDSNS
ncbi:MAG: hypothetical protein U9R28_08490 [Pseudomonadota bacterium]|nr:hypothetical protein [Pseudomonadota bacterium]